MELHGELQQHVCASRKAARAIEDTEQDRRSRERGVSLLDFVPFAASDRLSASMDMRRRLGYDMRFTSTGTGLRSMSSTGEVFCT